MKTSPREENNPRLADPQATGTILGRQHTGAAIAGLGKRGGRPFGTPPPRSTEEKERAELGRAVTLVVGKKSDEHDYERFFIL
jgi:hypothetical protein